jgi:ribosomal protein S18 acetylase RimI-like enzyme
MSSVGHIEIVEADQTEIDDIVDVLSGAARWLIKRGIEQWPDPFPRDRVQKLVERGEFYVARLGGKTAGTFALRWSDPLFWGDQPPVAGYLHALAVRREFAGLGPTLLDWAAERVREEGRELLRLDCRTENADLRRYYERHGFVHRGDTTVDDFRTSLYERLVA